MILYTDDGHMSAQLADADMGGYIAYGGRFSVEAWARSDVESCTTTSPCR